MQPYASVISLIHLLISFFFDPFPTPEATRLAWGKKTVFSLDHALKILDLWISFNGCLTRSDL